MIILVMMIPKTFVIGLFTREPIKSLRFVIISIGIMARGSAKLSVTWLKTRARIGLIPNPIIIIAGVIVISLLMFIGMFKPIKPFMIVCPAIVPTAEEDKPEAKSAIPKAPLDNDPINGDNEV